MSNNTVYSKILGHYYGHLMSINHYYPVFHSCNEVYNCQKGDMLPCTKGMYDQCDERDSCELINSQQNLFESCNALEIENYNILIPYFSLYYTNDYISNDLICYKNRLFFIGALIDTNYPALGEDNEALNYAKWLVERILVICLSTTLFKKDKNILKRFINVINNKESTDESSFLNELDVINSRHNLNGITTDINKMLYEAIVELKEHSNNVLNEISIFIILFSMISRNRLNGRISKPGY